MPRFVAETGWPHIDPGKKRHTIQIQAQTGTNQDAYGEVSGSWNVVVECFAAIETMTVREQFQDGFVSQVVQRISIDWPREPIDASMRLVVQPVRGAAANVFQIQAVENVQQRNLVARLTCLEIDSAKVGS